MLLEAIPTNLEGQETLSDPLLIHEDENPNIMDTRPQPAPCETQAATSLLFSSVSQSRQDH